MPPSAVPSSVDLRAALGRSLIGARQAPAPVLRRCLVDLAGCTVAPTSGRRASDVVELVVSPRLRPAEQRVRLVGHRRAAEAAR